MKTLYSIDISNLAAASILAVALLSSCGRSNGEADTYSETITAEELGIEDFSEQSLQDRPSDTDTPDIETSSEQESQPIADSANNAANLSDSLPAEPPRKHIKTGRGANYAEIFNDSNHFQLLHAQRLGIDPITDLRSYYRNKRPLIKIKTNDDYVLEELTHSYPYLIPEADRLLHDIGRNFRDSLRARGAKEYKIVVTSVLRTPATVKKLRRINRNATELSTHQYATTFDLSYNKFVPVSGPDDVNYGDLKTVLAEVIADLHKDGRCMVKYERKSPCFHITVVR